MYCHEEAVGVSIINSFNSYLGGTENTSGCSSVSPSGSSSSFIRVSTQVRSGLRWTGTWASHDLRTGSGQSGEGAGRSVGESRQDHKSDTIINGCLQQGVGFTLFCSQDAVWFVEYEAFWLILSWIRRIPSFKWRPVTSDSFINIICHWINFQRQTRSLFFNLITSFCL